MKKISLVLNLLAALLLTGCNLIGLNGSGVRATEKRTLAEISSVDLHISADVNISFGKEQSVTVAGDDNLLSVIKTYVHNGKLVIDSSESYSTSLGITLDLVLVKPLERISVDGSGDIDIKEMSSEEFSVDIDGSGSIRATGNVNKLGIFVYGSGSVKFFDLIANDVFAKLDGSGDINVTANSTLNAEIDGSGDIRYKGSCKVVNSEVSGSGAIYSSN